MLAVKGSDKLSRKKYKEAIATGERIRQIRIEKGMSMEELGALLIPPASKGAVSNWENGYNLPNNARLKQLSEVLEISTLYLLTGKKTLTDFEKDSKKETIDLPDFVRSLGYEDTESVLNYSLKLLNDPGKYNEPDYFALNNLYKLIDELNHTENLELIENTKDFIGVTLQNIRLKIKDNSTEHLNSDLYKKIIKEIEK